MASLRFVWQVGRFRGNLEERRPRAGGRRTSWPRIRERRREAQSLRMPPRIDPETGSRRAPRRERNGGSRELINKEGCSPPRVTPLRYAVQLTPEKRHE